MDEERRIIILDVSNEFQALVVVAITITGVICLLLVECRGRNERDTNREQREQQAQPEAKL